MTVVQHWLNGGEDPQSLSTASSHSETQENAETSCRHLDNVLVRAKTYLHNHWQHLEIVLLVVVIAVVLILLLLPTVFYHLPPQSVSTLALCKYTTTWERKPMQFQS